MASQVEKSLRPEIGDKDGDRLFQESGREVRVHCAREGVEWEDGDDNAGGKVVSCFLALEYEGVV